MHRIGLAPLTALELAPPDFVTCAAEAGFDFVGLRLIPATAEEKQHAMVGDTALVRETARRVANAGIPVLDVEIFRLKPQTVVADYRPALETAKRFGAREALVAGNDPDEARLIDRFGQFCDLASEYGINANLEPMPWTDVKSFAQGVRVLDAAARKNSGLLIDPIHFDRGGSRVSEIGGVSPARLRYLQFCDAPAARPKDMKTILHQARAARLMPGDGGLDLKGIASAVPSDIPISLEIPMDELARTMPAVERTRQMLAKTRRVLEAL